jgi:hypothetical protein
LLLFIAPDSEPCKEILSFWDVVEADIKKAEVDCKDINSKDICEYF